MLEDYTVNSAYVDESIESEGKAKWKFYLCGVKVIEILKDHL